MGIIDYARDFEDFAPYAFTADRGRSWTMCLDDGVCGSVINDFTRDKPIWFLQSYAGPLWSVPMTDLFYGGTTLNGSLSCPADTETIVSRDRLRRRGLLRSVQTWTTSYLMSGAFLWDPAALDPAHAERLVDARLMRGQTLGSVVFPSSRILVGEMAPYHDRRFYSRADVPHHPHDLQFAHVDGSVIQLMSDLLTPGVVPDPTGLSIPGYSTDPLDFSVLLPAWGVRGLDH